MPRRVLVTGASGFIGSHVCKSLVSAGVTVRASTRASGLGKQLEKLKLAHEVHVGDLRDPQLIRGIAKDCDAVLHFADDRHVHSKTVWEVSVEGTANLLEEVRRESAVSSVVFASSMAVYGPQLHNPTLFDPTSELAELQPYGEPYADAKLETERRLAAFAAEGGPAVTILRFPAVYGIASKAWTRRYVSNARRNQLRCFGTGDYVFRYLHIDSAVAAVMCALEAKGFGVYNVYDGTTTMNRFLQYYGDMFDPPRPVKHVPLWLVKYIFTLSGLMPGAVWTPQTLLPLTEPVTDQKLLLPCTRATEVLGWSSRADINVAMQEIKRHFVDGERVGTPKVDPP